MRMYQKESWCADMSETKYRIIWPAFEEWARENDVSLRRFAYRLGISPHTFTNYLYGFTDPPLSVCRKMSEITGISLDELLRED